MAEHNLTPRSFFLNEQHELTRGEKDGGGGIPKYAPINWGRKGRRIQSTLHDVREKIHASLDPTKDNHYFLLARPQARLRKLTDDKKKAQSGIIEEVTSYSGKDSRVFSRLGMDLLRVANDGSAVVHTTPERAEQLESTAAALDEFGIREKVRWATIDSFDLVPLEHRIDKEWLDSLSQGHPTDAVRKLESFCERGARPYAATVRALLATTATEPVGDAAVSALVKRTLGYGTARADRLDSPLGETAVLLWQGVLEDKNDVARIQIPIPKEWLKEASAPKLRLIIAADVPVNAAVSQIWASRKIVARLRHHPEANALRGRLKAVDYYTLVGREYNLSRVDTDELESDIWNLELNYDEIADYLPSMAFPSQQRVAFAAELFDADNFQSSPQSFLQALAFTRTMTRLSVPASTTRVPIVLRYQA